MTGYIKAVQLELRITHANSQIQVMQLVTFSFPWFCMSYPWFKFELRFCNWILHVHLFGNEGMKLNPHV